MQTFRRPNEIVYADDYAGCCDNFALKTLFFKSLQTFCYS